MMFFADWFRSPSRIGFDDVLYAIRHTDHYILINTLPIHEQECLIQNTVPIEAEETTVNTLLTQYEKVVRKIIVYGKNATDPTVEKKYKQLVGLGIGDVYIYSGGLFEWMLLQDIYGLTEFPTTKKVLDILRHKPATLFV
jgi:hypothetical protein